MIIRIIDASIVKTVNEKIPPSMIFLRMSIFRFQRRLIGKRMTLVGLVYILANKRDDDLGEDLLATSDVTSIAVCTLRFLCKNWAVALSPHVAASVRFCLIEFKVDIHTHRNFGGCSNAPPWRQRYPDRKRNEIIPQCKPPESSLPSDMVAKSLEEEQKGQFDAPQAETV